MISNQMEVECEGVHKNKSRILHLARSKIENSNLSSTRVELKLIQSTRFYTTPKHRDVTTQYANLYFNRLEKLSTRFEKIAKVQFIPSIQQISDQSGSIQVIGTIYKEMKLKPYYFAQVSGLQSYISKDDQLYLEDKTGRVKVQLSPNCKLVNHLGGESGQEVTIDNLYTGIVVLADAWISSNNIITVNKLYLPQIEPAPIPNYLAIDCYICFLSGLNYDSQQSSQQVQKLVYFLQGNLAASRMVSQIARIIVAGNLYSKVEKLENIVNSIKQNQEFKNMQAQIQKNISDVDELLSQLCSITPVEVLPGPNEPVPQMLPQQCLPKIYFPMTLKKAAPLTLLTNPTQVEVGGFTILGTSGQNIIDIEKYSTLNENENQVDILERTLLSNVMAPTCPDTLQCLPIQSHDIFSIDRWPNIYFAGNMRQFGTKLLGGATRIVSIPTFSTTGEICFVNLRDLSCFSVKLN